MSASYILLLSCPDQRGIVHAVTGFLMDQGGNITEAAQYDDKATGLFFMRVQFDLPAASDKLSGDFEAVRARFGIQAQFYDAERPTPTVIMVSQNGQCLNHLLFRNKAGLLNLDVRAIVSNHRDFYQLAASYNIPFHHVPVTAKTKPEAEAKLFDIFKSEGGELLVLARYMQILSDDLCKKLQGKAINIHHSFLPSFKGAKPYYQAHDRGVKLTGATAHYVTGDLDEGPIIEQDVARVDHAMTPETLTTTGGDTECIVLTRAVKWHSEHRILLNGHKTVVFK
jgi:formyltetrahydrofolate deformylase